MSAAAPLSFPSSGSTRNLLLRHRRSSPLPPYRIPRSPLPPCFFASCTSFAEGERRKSDSDRRRWAAEPAGALAAGTLYDVLGLPAGATAQEIKAAFRRLARERHPDVVPPRRRSESAEEFMRIHAAYATLSDPDKRAEYDRGMVASRSAAGAASNYYCRSPAPFNCSSPSGFPRRTWETDQCW